MEFKRKPKALVLLSGGLDSLLATRIILEHGVDVEAVHFATLFCRCGCDSIIKVSKELGIKIHNIFWGQEFLDVVTNPRYGYGSKMNPCIDCRILMFRKAKELAAKINADFLVTGEVLDERPFSQRLRFMKLIEKAAELEGKILRPLSAKLLPLTEAEEAGWVNREKLFNIKGRRRIMQIKLAAKYGIKDYPNPSGGCLLTDPTFARKVRDHLKYEGKLTIDDAILLMIGRHFRIEGVKVVVGRNKDENNRLLAIAQQRQIPYLMVKEYKGPITLIVGEEKLSVIKKAAELTLRYSDAPKDISLSVIYKHVEKESEIAAIALTNEQVERFRI
jgi:tRNA U34 2-thiouridine synthase MnmA/TrmU